MLLGIDFFLSHHVFVAHSQNRLYFTYNGGPVFQLDQPQPRRPPAPTAAAPSDAGRGPRTRPPNRPIRTRSIARAPPCMARREYEAALTPSRAPPSSIRRRRRAGCDRARAELALKRPVLAMSDLDQAIELKPDDVTALMMRGELLLNRGEFDTAQADFEAAAKAAPPDDGRAAAHRRKPMSGTSRYEPAIPHSTPGSAPIRRSPPLRRALNGRCWARAMLGRDLDKALADCDAAIRQGPAIPPCSTAGAWCTFGWAGCKAAIADYDAALRAPPKLAWSLYGRGLAKKRLGQTAEGEADIQAAVALSRSFPTGREDRPRRRAGRSSGPGRQARRLRNLGTRAPAASVSTRRACARRRPTRYRGRRLARAEASPTRSGPEGSSRNEFRSGSSVQSPP